MVIGSSSTRGWSSRAPREENELRISINRHISNNLSSRLICSPKTAFLDCEDRTAAQAWILNAAERAHERPASRYMSMLVLADIECFNK